MLFNLIMIGLAKRLQTVSNVNHTIYADDITIWSFRGSDGQIETALQDAIEVVEEYLAGTGLRCSPKKSELLLYRPTLKGRPPKSFVKTRANEEIKLHTKDGGTIPIVKRIRVLGMLIESNGVNGETITKLTHKVTSAVRLLKRVTNRRGGLKEDSLIRLIHSFVICHIAYVASMHNWYKGEKNKIDTIIRKAYKVALGLPESTSTERLLRLGIHNTLDEIAEAQRVSHLERLTLTSTGRHILQELGITYHRQHGDKVDIPKEIREKIHVAPAPRNMNPIYNPGRRKARAALLLKTYCNDKNTRFTDAARYQDGRRFAIVVINTEKTTTHAASVKTRHPEVAEEMAIALAITDADTQTVLSDSRTAVRNFAKGRISTEALRILVHAGQISQATLIWIPAHMGEVCPHFPNLNEAAHSAARDAINRAGGAGLVEEYADRDRLTGYNELTKAFYLARRCYPPPHGNLCRAQAVTWRQLQTNRYPNLLLYHRIYPEIYSTSICKVCQTDTATLTHMLWECEAKAKRISPDVLSARWEAALRSSKLADQLWAVQQAREAAERQGLDVPTWET
uniref:Putative tick transposon n=1 Tax=Rhipicephalus pulchellus TaxID=72859 RepID=L7LX14_RHIPC